MGSASSKNGMRACVHSGLVSGSIHLRADAAVPEPSGSNEVRVAVRAAAINPVDYKLPPVARRGAVGLDCAGIIESIGGGQQTTAAGDTAFAVGDEVYGNSQSGALADFAICRADAITHRPPTLTWAQAASIPTVYLTAYQALNKHGGLSARVAAAQAAMDSDSSSEGAVNTDEPAGAAARGVRVLIIGASGGTGLAAVQLARAMGAEEIVGVCSGRNADFVRGEGASAIVDYTRETALDRFGPAYFDIIVDCATASGGGEDYTAQTQELIEPDKGITIALNGSPVQWGKHFIGFESHRRKIILTEHSGADLAAIEELRAKSGFVPVVDNVFEFSEEGIERGFERLKSRHARGKIVFAISSDESPTTAGADKVAQEQRAELPVDQ